MSALARTAAEARWQRATATTPRAWYVFGAEVLSRGRVRRAKSIRYKHYRYVVAFETTPGITGIRHAVEPQHRRIPVARLGRLISPKPRNKRP
jgi:hypothetical protein